MYNISKSLLSFWLAIGLLTRFPVPSSLQTDTIQEEDSGRSVLFYPLVGLIIGLILYLPIFFFPDASPTLTAAIIVTLWAIITGGLHLDGLADSADAWLGGMGDKEKIHRIMKDPLVGSAGVIAIVCLLLLKVTALSSLLQNGQEGQNGNEALIILTPLIGRSMILLLFLSTPYIRQQGMATNMVNHLPRNVAWWIVGLCLLCCLLFSFWGIVFVLLGFFLLRRLMLKILGGCTGDTIGASVEISEMLFILGIALT